MRVLLLTVAPDPTAPGATGIDHCACQKLRECAAMDPFREHSLTDDPEEADLILFAEMGFSSALGALDARLRRHPLVARYRSRCFVFSTADAVVPYLPGVYASIEKRAYDPRRVRSGHYLSSHITEPPLVTRSFADRDLLFSFVGTGANHPVRRDIVALRHPRGLCRDTSRESARVWAEGAAAVAKFLGDYAEVMSRSRFALCPRGIGASSIRLFESMRFGVAPVIVSDQWVEPTGPDWGAFSLRVPERDVARIPTLLEELEPRSEEMGRLARLAWEDWFSDRVSFHRVVNWCREIMESRAPSGDPLVGRARAYAEALRPLHLRSLIRHLRA
jgi:hypothetical protein